MYLIFPIKSIEFFKNVITSKNDILCAEAGSFAAEGSEYFCGGREKVGKSKMLIFQANDSKFHIIPKIL
jgi:hypothetical protein